MKIKILPVLLVSYLLMSCNNQQPEKQQEEAKTVDMDKEVTTSLKMKLEERKTNFARKADDNKKRAYQEGIASVENSGIISSAKQVGEKAPDFKLNNALGKPVALSEYLKKGKVVLTWYRGNWCPYCNLTLHALQEELSNLKANGANLIALTPELPDESISTSEKHDLQFEVLSDVGNKVAKEYGIVFQLTPEVAEMYNQSFQLNNHNGDQSNELPLAATYIIDENGEIVYAFLDADVSLSTHWLTEMLALLKEKKERLLVSAMQINGENPPPLEQIRTVLSNAEIDCNVNFLPGRNLLLARETFIKVKGFPEHLTTCEDYYFTDKVHELGELYYSSNATYIHIGEDKEYLQMYHKEIWRGQSNLQSIKGRSIPLREWPSFIIPIGMLVLFTVSLLCLLFGQIEIFIISILLAIFPACIYSVRLFLIANKKIPLRYIILFYSMYFPARAIGTVAGIFKSFSIKENK